MILFVVNIGGKNNKYKTLSFFLKRERFNNNVNSFFSCTWKIFNMSIQGIVETPLRFKAPIHTSII